jgi:ComF family protein
MNFTTRAANESLLRVADALLVATLAPPCAACARVLAQPTRGPVCEGCWAAIPRLKPPLCRICGGMLPSWRALEADLPRCEQCRQRGESVIDEGRTAGDYDGSLRAIIHAFKYDGRRGLAARLGALTREAGVDLLTDAACAVPTPLHPWRRFRRGFNQASDLAATLNLPVVHALRRSRITAPQTGLTAAARRANVRGAFSLSPFMSRRTRTSMLVDRIVVLVDDVRTTGATLEACALVLKAAGVREVRALTVARAEAPGRSRVLDPAP